jgi:hypothetical protein
MADSPRVTRTILTDKEPGGKEIRIMWLGEFGHLLMNVLPRVNKMRLENPNARIVFAGYEDDMIYFKDDKGNWTIDEYWGVPWWPTDRGCHECKGVWPSHILALQREINVPAFNTTILDTTKMTLAGWSAEFKQKPRIAYPLKYIVQEDPLLENKSYCVVYARAKNYESTVFRSWHDDRWVKFVELLLQEYNGKVYVCGVEEESIKFPWSDRLINFTNLKGLERSSKTLNILSGADFCISDCSGSGNFAIQVGIPTFVSGPPGYAEGFEKNKNYFGVHVMYQTIHMDALTPELRMNGWRHFMKDLHYRLGRDVYEGVVA